MSAKFLVAIPSLGRPGWKTLGWLRANGVDDSRICLFLHTKDELKAYREAQDISKIKIYVTRASNIAEQRTAILRELYPRQHVQLDDDVAWMKKVTMTNAGQLLARPVYFDSTVEMMFEDARQLKCKVFGLSANSNMMFSWDAVQRYFRVQAGKYFGRSFIGVDGYKCKLTSKYAEDLELALSALKDGAGICRFNEYIFKSDHYKPGGCGLWMKTDVWHIYRAIAERFKDQVKTFGCRPLKRTLKETAENHKAVQK